MIWDLGVQGRGGIGDKVIMSISQVRLRSPGFSPACCALKISVDTTLWRRYVGVSSRRVTM